MKNYTFFPDAALTSSLFGIYHSGCLSSILFVRFYLSPRILVKVCLDVTFTDEIVENAKAQAAFITDGLNQSIFYE